MVWVFFFSLLSSITRFPCVLLPRHFLLAGVQSPLRLVSFVGELGKTFKMRECGCKYLYLVCVGRDTGGALAKGLDSVSSYSPIHDGNDCYDDGFASSFTSFVG